MSISRVLSVLAVSLIGLLAAGLPAGGQPQPPEQPPPKYPMTGKAVPMLEPIDKAVVAVLARHGIPGASLAIARDGKLLYARGYGWADLRADEHVKPDTLFALASLSKVFTALAVLKLVEQGKLGLDDKPFEIIKHIKPNPGAKVDPRLSKITVRHLLIHAGGWDTQKSGDPVNWTTQVNLQRNGRDTLTTEQLIAFTLGVPLDFDPGTDCKYSNFGYIVLGEVIEKASGQSYEKFVKEAVFKPAGVSRPTLHPLNDRYFPNEARRYLAGHGVELPPWQEKKADAAGGWSASAVDIVRVLTALDGSRGQRLLAEKTFNMMTDPPAPPIEPRSNGTYFAPGWDSAGRTEKVVAYQKGGNWFGTRTFAQRTPVGVNWAILMNASLDADPGDAKVLQDAIRDVREAMEKHKAFPDHDLFDDFK
jgi:N-acyl-D-amino-acid deacylase